LKVYTQQYRLVIGDFKRIFGMLDGEKVSGKASNSLKTSNITGVCFHSLIIIIEQNPYLERVDK
jgi:hypothetical protein